MADQLDIKEVVSFDTSLKRFDQIAAKLFPQYSRARLQAWIKTGELTVDGKTRLGKEKLQGGEVLHLNAKLPEDVVNVPQDVPFEVIYEDEDVIVVNKQAGLIVHPGAGAPDGTLLNGLLFRFPELTSVPRAGIVHRLDKDTTGLMVVARTLEAHTCLIEQLQSREMGREYEAVVMGQMTGGGQVEEPIGRHPTARTKMAVHPMGKEAITHYRILERFRHHTHLRLKLETGRTHQIRVHMSHLNYPLVGDTTYAGRFRLPKGIIPELKEELKGFNRQALHAQQLEFYHPAKDELMHFEAPLPEDFVSLLLVMQQDSKDHDDYYA